MDSATGQLAGKWMLAIGAALLACCAAADRSSAAIITGTSGNDFLAGTPQADGIGGGQGNDLIDGRGGGDVMQGDPGNDTVLYNTRTAPLTVTMTAPVVFGCGLFPYDECGHARNDGEQGERDDVREDVENLISGAGNDKVTGNERPNVILGGTGADTIKTAGGADTIYVNDGVRDSQIACGAGYDTVYADRFDPIDQNCEARVYS